MLLDACVLDAVKWQEACEIANGKASKYSIPTKKGFMICVFQISGAASFYWKVPYKP